MKKWVNWVIWFIILALPGILGNYVRTFIGNIAAGFTTSAVYVVVWLLFEHGIFDNIDRLIRRKTKKEHESGLPMAEWEERQRLKELDEKLQTGKYTSAEKEHLIYTANLTSENKNTLRQKHLPSQKNPL